MPPGAEVVGKIATALKKVGITLDTADVLKRLGAAKPDAFVPVITLRRPQYDLIRPDIHDLPGASFPESERMVPLTATFARALLGNVDAVTEEFDGVHGSVLVIGFGRFGQIVSQCLLVEGVDVTAIDNSAGMIQNASRFGFKVYYGDGTRLDVLRAAGTTKARLVAVCVDDRDAASRIVDLVQAEFPGTLIYVRSFDRRHSRITGRTSVANAAFRHSSASTSSALA